MSCGWRRAASALAPTLVVTILPACTSAPADGAERAVIRDSSGVQIVEHGGLPAARDFTSAPTVDIGGNEQAPHLHWRPIVRRRGDNSVSGRMRTTWSTCESIRYNEQ